MPSYLKEAIDLAEHRTEQQRRMVRATLGGEVSNPILGGLGDTLDFRSQSEHTEQLEHYKGTTHTAISRIATVLAGQPMQVGRIVPEPVAPRRAVKGFLGDNIEPVPDHELLQILRDPNPAMPLWGHIYTTAAILQINGVGYWWFDESGDQPAVWALPGSWVTPKHSKTELYIGYEVRSSWQGEGRVVPPEEMVSFSLPDPANPLGYVSPLQAHAPEVALDEEIVMSQHRSMRNAPNPSLVLRTGRLPGMQPGMPGERPVMTRSQRIDLIEAVRAWYAGVVNSGEPLIIDGMIEGVDKLNLTPREMDYIRSGETGQGRLMRAFGVNPIIVGQIEGANRAQAAVALQLFYLMVVNPLAELISQSVTRWARARYGEDIVFGIEPARPHDAEQSLKEWELGLREGCGTRNEYRTEVLRLPPYDDPAMDVPKPASGGGGGGGGGLFGADEEDEEEGNEDDDVGVAAAARRRLQKADELGPASLSFRKLVEIVWVRQLESHELDMVEVMGRYFRRQARAIRTEAKRLARESPELFGTVEGAETVAAMLYSPRDWDGAIRAAVFKPLVRSVLAGYLAEKALFESRRGKQSDRELTAEELQILEFEVPDEVRERVRNVVQESMAQDYWDATNNYTVDVIQSAVRNGVLEGMSPGKIASAIFEASSDVDRVRSKRIARTEIGRALNAGHHVQAQELEGQGLQVIKTWVTVGDNDVRPSHVDMEGQTTEGAGGEFNVEGVLVPYPRHFALPPEQSINCRCSFFTDMKEGGGSYEERQAEWESTLQPARKAAIHSYSKEAYTPMRNCQNTGKGCTEKTKKLIKQMKDALKEAPKFEGEVYRGLSFETDGEAFDFVVGANADGGLTTRGFTSTTKARHIADEFAFLQEGREPSSSVILKVKSKRGVSIENLSDQKDEREVILQPGARLKIIGGPTQDEAGSWILEMEEV